MPDSIDMNDDVYNEVKSLRSSKTSKRLRRLRAFERIYYKKTCEVKKTGHSLDEAHQLNDGNLRYSARNLTYSLNKKKRWLLPEIIEERICEYNPNSESQKANKGDQISTIDERLKIIMYENENIRHSSTCIRYGNNQTEPHILHKNGRRFNSNTLTKWMDFNTRERWNSHHRNNQNDRINQPNFGFQQRPGFFPSEVTYEFLYPKRLSPCESHRNSRVSLAYTSAPETYGYGRHYKDTNKNRRKIRRYECLKYNMYDDEEEYDFEGEDLENNEYIVSSSDLIDEDEKWTIVFEESDDQFVIPVDFPIDYFIPLPSPPIDKSLDGNQPKKIIDHKAYKSFEPPPSSSTDKKVEKPPVITEKLLCAIPCKNESNFLLLMQNSTMKISQANLSPPIFLQKTSNSTFSVIYTYSRQSSMIDVAVKFTDTLPNIVVDPKQIRLEELIKLIANKLDDEQMKIKNQTVQNSRLDVDALRGSLPLPITVSQKMLLVKPNSTDKQTALELENLVQNNKNQSETWFDTTKNSVELSDCAICCETLTLFNAYQLLPCYHSLCYTCLTSYIRTNISSVNPSILTCFQPNCPTQINSTLIQAFVSYDIYQSYHQSFIERHLFSTGHYRKCPSRICSNLLIIDDETKPSLMCSCGQRVCSSCLEEHHFPATCKQYKSYLTRLRQSSDHLLSLSKTGDNSSCYVAEGKNCPSCGEFVEKNGGCPHMTCKCGNEYCWMCLKRWATHNYSACFNVPESTHELRSSTRSRSYNKALHHRRQRNQHIFDSLTSDIQRLSKDPEKTNLLLSTYIDLNTLAEFVYVLLQKRHIDGNIRAVLNQTATRLESDAFQIKLQIERKQIKDDYIHLIRSRLERTFCNLLYMKQNKIFM